MLHSIVWHFVSKQLLFCIICLDISSSCSRYTLKTVEILHGYVLSRFPIDSEDYGNITRVPATNPSPRLPTGTTLTRATRRTKSSRTCSRCPTASGSPSAPSCSRAPTSTPTPCPPASWGASGGSSPSSSSLHIRPTSPPSSPSSAWCRPSRTPRTCRNRPRSRTAPLLAAPP